jgi:hypothetical protein
VKVSKHRLLFEPSLGSLELSQGIGIPAGCGGEVFIDALVGFLPPPEVEQGERVMVVNSPDLPRIDPTENIQRLVPLPQPVIANGEGVEWEAFEKKANRHGAGASRALPTVPNRGVESRRASHQVPSDYPYAGLLPWYNLGLDRVAVDVVLHEDTPHLWHEVAIRSIHLPGHCYCHAAYLLTFNGLRLAITGDSIQSDGEAGGLNFIISNHSVPDEHSGILKTYRQMVAEPVDLNLGAHGSHFTNCAAMYAESLCRIEYALPYLRRLVPGGDLEAAFLRPNFPRWVRQGGGATPASPGHRNAG